MGKYIIWKSLNEKKMDCCIHVGSFFFKFGLVHFGMFLEYSADFKVCAVRTNKVRCGQIKGPPKAGLGFSVKKSVKFPLRNNATRDM